VIQESAKLFGVHLRVARQVSQQARFERVMVGDRQRFVPWRIRFVGCFTNSLRVIYPHASEVTVQTTDRLSAFSHCELSLFNWQVWG
jgi:hypothetical protein